MKPVIEQIPYFADNIAWLVRCENSALVVDPGNAEAVSSFIDREGITLSGILVTHHHSDHIGGLDKMINRTGAPVYGPNDRRLPLVNHHVHDGETIDAGAFRFEVISVPGHTSTHVAYYFTDCETIFTGDVLFAGGCGRVFEGSPAEMLASLKRIAELPPKTLVCCGHDYTRSNLEFAMTVDRNNLLLAQRLASLDKRERFMPETIAVELATNPFLRCGDEGIRASIKMSTGDSDEDVFARLRSLKNSY